MPLPAGALALAITTGAAAAFEAGRRRRRRDALKPQRRFRRVFLEETPLHAAGDCDGGDGDDGAPTPRGDPHADVIAALVRDPPLPSDVLRNGGEVEAPSPVEHTPLVWVATRRALANMAGDLRSARRFALDVEHSPRAYHGITCLLQLSTGEG